MKELIVGLINGWTIHPFNDPSMRTLAAHIDKEGYTVAELNEAVEFLFTIEEIEEFRDVFSVNKIFDDFKESKKRGNLQLLTLVCQQSAFIKKALIVFNNNHIAFLEWYRTFCATDNNRQDVSYLVTVLPLTA
ncbi:MAG: hypothetical protein MUD00_03500 [Candidatus Pacebacteria bacterium]|jgi:hypothetical protein|nr:hypothetical protein [Candidatus Paceibacterota bacterium]